MRLQAGVWTVCIIPPFDVSMDEPFVEIGQSASLSHGVRRLAHDTGALANGVGAASFLIGEVAVGTGDAFFLVG